MPKIQHFKIPGKVGADGILRLDHSKREKATDDSEFDEARIAFNAQEVAEFNKQEMGLCEQLGEGEYMVEYKLIV